VPRQTDERGIAAIEYALIAMLIAVAIIMAVVLVGRGVSSVYNNISSHVISASSG
jgi:Flp pilus assembly pilin Flp